MFDCRSARSLRRALCQLAAGTAMVLVSVAAAYAQRAPAVKILADAACPLLLESAMVTADSAGVSIAYSIRNGEKESVKEVVITAAAVNFLGEVVSLRMQPVRKKIAAGSSQQFTVVFPDLDLKDADVVSVGVQGIRWSGRREEWRTALRVSSGPTILAAKK